MKYIKSIVLIIILLFLFTDIKAQSYSQLAEVISSGGGESTGGNYSNFGVIGETFVDYSVIGGNYNTSIGFLYASYIPTRIDKLNYNNQSISIFPNPTTSFISIDGENIEIIEITNIEGQIIYQIEVYNDKISIDLSSQSKGVYFVKVITNKGIAIKKIVVE